MRLRFKSFIIFDILLAIVFGMAIVISFGYNDRARFAPLVIAVPGLLVMLGRILYQLFRSQPASGNGPQSGGHVNLAAEEHTGDIAESTASNTSSKKPKRDLKSELNAILWIVALFVLLYIVGFIVAIPVYLFLFMKVRSQEKPVFSLLFSAVSCVVLYLFFVQLLHVPLYDGVIAENLF